MTHIIKKVIIFIPLSLAFACAERPDASVLLSEEPALTATDEKEGETEETSTSDLEKENPPASSGDDAENTEEKENAAQAALAADKEACTKEGRYFDTFVQKCSDRNLWDVECSEEALLGEESDLLGGNQKEQIKGLLADQYQDYKIESCLDEEENYTLVITADKDGQKHIRELKVPK